jgi:hypothetical protein
MMGGEAGRGAPISTIDPKMSDVSSVATTIQLIIKVARSTRNFNKKLTRLSDPNSIFLRLFSYAPFIPPPAYLTPKLPHTTHLLLHLPIL